MFEACASYGLGWERLQNLIARLIERGGRLDVATVGGSVAPIENTLERVGEDRCSEKVESSVLLKNGAAADALVGRRPLPFQGAMPSSDSPRRLRSSVQHNLRLLRSGTSVRTGEET